MKFNLKGILILFICVNILPAYAQKNKKKKKDKTTPSYVVNNSGQSKLAGERFFFDGQREKIIGNTDLAYQNFAKAIKQNPKLDAAYFEMAQIELQAYKYDEAEQHMLKALDLSPQNIWYNQFYANILAAQNKYAEAAHIYSELKNGNPNQFDYAYREAYYYIMNNDLKKALTVYDELEKEVGVQAELALQKHKLYNELGETDKAIQELEKIKDADPNNQDISNTIAQYYIQIGETAKGIKIFEEILAVQPDNITALTSLADYYSKNGDKEQALVYQKRAFSNTEIPLDAKIGVLYSYIQYFEDRKKDIDDAFTLAELLIDAHPNDAKVYSIAGDLRNLNEEPEKALTYYNQSLELQKDIFTVWQQVFFINSDLENYTELEAKTKEAKTYFPNQAMVYFFSGIAKQELDKPQEAIKDYNRGVKMTGENNLLKAQFYANLGNLYNDTKDYKKSDECFERALEINPTDAYTLNNYSYYLSLRKENLEKAAEMSLLSNDLQPDNSSFLDTYAWILYQKGEYQKALEYQEKALAASQKPSDTLLEHLGDIHYKLGNKDEAISHWKNAQQYGEGSDFLQKKISEGKLYE